MSTILAIRKSVEDRRSLPPAIYLTRRFTPSAGPAVVSINGMAVERDWSGISIPRQECDSKLNTSHSTSLSWIPMAPR
jgi:hypothetical protein